MTTRKKKVPRPMWKELSAEEADDETARGLARRTNVATLNSVYRSVERMQRVLVRAIWYAQYGEEIDGKEESE